MKNYKPSMMVLSFSLFAAFSLNLKIILTVFPHSKWKVALRCIKAIIHAKSSADSGCCFRKRELSAAVKEYFCTLKMFGFCYSDFLLNPLIHFLGVSDMSQLKFSLF